MAESFERSDCGFCKRAQGFAKEALFLSETKNALIFAGDHQFFEGYCVVISKVHVREMHSLPEEVRIEIFNDVMKVGKLISEHYALWKINYASFGNVMEHLHWHVIPRYESDPNKKMHPWHDAEMFQHHPTSIKDLVKLKSIFI